jgi:class 3 adenylate cyclase
VATEERKTVTALFCDLEGFTQRAERLDPEDVRALLGAYHERVGAQLERFGGTLEKFIGDAVVALFGAPRAHEDDPERAVRAALAALDAVATLSAERPGLDLHAKIGVTTGEALVDVAARPGEGRAMAWGDVLSTAARLQAAASRDEILVDEPTYRATREVVAYAAVEPVRAKGKAERVPAHRAVGLRPGGEDGAGASGRPRRQLVNRREELELLLELLERVRRERTPRRITLVGEPGIGKSSLVGELVGQLDLAEGPVAWRQGRSPPYPEGIPFWALGEIVKAQAGVLDTDGAELAGGKLHRAVAELIPEPAAAARIEAHLRSLVGLDAEAPGERDDAFAAWRQFFEAVAARQPLVLAFEDVHWADEGLLDFVDHLVAWAEQAPLLVVCTARPELLAARPGWGAQGRGAKLVLAPLSHDDTRELVARVAGAPLGAGRAEDVVARSSGNPLYTVELVRMLAERGLLEPAGDAAPAEAADALPLPDSLRAIIATRIDTLSPEEKAVLQAAAVIGRGVWPDGLAAIAEQPREWVVERLRSLEGRQILTPASRSSVEHEPEYRFHHVLVRDVAYEGIPRRRRRELHERTADWLASLPPDRATERAEMLAHHLSCAHALARATGTESAQLAERARLALRDAGDRALALHGFPAAARLYERALELWPPDDPERPWLLFRLGRSVYSARTAGADVLTEARDALLAAGDPGTAAEAEVLLAGLAYHGGRRALVREHLDRAVTLVADLGPSRSKASVLVDLATYRSLAREHEATIAAASEALDIAERLGLRELQAMALSMMGISKGLSGDLSGRDELLRSIAICEEIGSHLVSQSYGILADLEGQLGDLAACFALQARARRHAERFGHAGFVRWLAAERVGELYWTGAWDEAVEVADGFIAEAEAGRQHWMEGWCRLMRGRIRLARGDEAGALDDAASALTFSRAAEDPQTLYPALAFGARAEAAAGAPDRARALVDELFGAWTADLDAFPASAWVVDLAIAAAASSREAELLAAAARVATPTRWLQAVIALLSGAPTTAAEEFRAIGSLPDEALARLRAAQALRAAGREEEAAAELALVEAFARRVGAAALLAASARPTGERVATQHADA